MKEINCENFIAVLSFAIPESNSQKPAILHYAKQLLQAAEENGALVILEDPVIKRAQRLYIRSNPKKGNLPPSLPELIKWLRGRRGLDTIETVEKKLNKVMQYISSLGPLSPNDQFLQVPVDTIVALRFLVGYQPNNRRE